MKAVTGFLKTMMDGKAIKQYYPTPFLDKNGDLWTYDPEYGWQNTKMMQQCFEQVWPKKPSAGTIGRVMVFGTFGDLDGDGDFKKMFYQQDDDKQ